MNMARAVEQFGQLAWFIPRRSQVQILSAQRSSQGGRYWGFPVPPFPFHPSLPVGARSMSGMNDSTTSEMPESGVKVMSISPLVVIRRISASP